MTYNVIVMSMMQIGLFVHIVDIFFFRSKCLCFQKPPENYNTTDCASVLFVLVLQIKVCNCYLLSIIIVKSFLIKNTLTIELWIWKIFHLTCLRYIKITATLSSSGKFWYAIEPCSTHHFAKNMTEIHI